MPLHQQAKYHLPSGSQASNAPKSLPEISQIFFVNQHVVFARSKSLCFTTPHHQKMAEQLSTPRISARYLDSFNGKLVMIWGKVTQLRGDQASIDSDGPVNVLLTRVCLPCTGRRSSHKRSSKFRGGQQALEVHTAPSFSYPETHQHDGTALLLLETDTSSCTLRNPISPTATSSKSSARSTPT